MKFVPHAVSRLAARSVLKAQTASPQLLFATGVVGVGTTVVLACKATLKIDEVLEEDRNARLTAAELRVKDDPRYSEDDYKKDMIYIQVRSAVKICKLYAPAITVGLVSVGMLAQSNRILTKRNAAVLAAYSALEKSFEDYRNRVDEKYGFEAERDIRYATEKQEVEVDGKTKKVKVATIGGSIYARFFDRNNKNWSPAPEYNLMFLRSVQNHLNDMLHARGHVFLNDAYDSLGIERSKEGAVVGWLRNNKDGYIDLGIFEGQDMSKFFDFVTGQEHGIWLDFNVDGIIYDRI